ncbi:MAG: EamA family transporter [Oscillospiraceae bacterium]|nr:EamA family transporter [Oscillospiraceae bacterium]
MLAYAWPIALVVVSNVVYQICAKSVPKGLDPFASLTVTYIVAAAASAVLYFALNRSPDLIAEYRRLNWVPFTLGLAVVGLEVGFIFAYRAGWPVSTASIVQASFLAVILLFVGFLLYKEALTAQKLIGVAICLVGLYFINK